MSIIGKLTDYKTRVANISSYKQFSYDEVISYINSFPEPKDNWERSYNQYKCNSKIYGINAFANFIRTVGCFLPFWVFIIRRGKAEKKEKRRNVFISDEHKMDIIPDKYKDSYIQVSRSEGWLLGKHERKTILKLWKRYPFSYYFLLKNLIKIANYKWAIQTYDPEAVLCSCEYSFSSSFLTDYCHSVNVKHINIQHGYNIVDLKCPFSTFDTMSIWDSFFTKTYKTMRCGTTHFEYVKPKCIELKKIPVNNEKTVIVYYLQNYVKTIVPTLLELIKLAKENDMVFKIRCHPAYPMEKEDVLKFPPDVFESYKEVNIEQSLNTADYVVARFSTVLYQSTQLDKNILIDDISMPEEYSENRKKGAFFWETDKTELLSSFLETKRHSKNN